MTVEIFSKADFEEALPINKTTASIMWEYEGLIQGEETYSIRVNKDCKITIRSSVRENGFSAATGKDSIRAWLVGNDGKPTGSKINSYTTRCPGWATRLTNILRELYGRGQKVKCCSKCFSLTKIFKVKKEGKNKGRLFTKCECSFKWLT